MDNGFTFNMLSMSFPEETCKVSSGRVYKLNWKGGDFIEKYHNYSGKN